MQMRYVEQAAQDAEIGLQGARVRIIRDPELLGQNRPYGYTHPDGSIDLYPNAFQDMEQLMKTLGHERTHTMQIELFGHPNTYAADPIEMMKQVSLNEKAATGIEETFWQHYQRNKSGKMDIFK